MPSSQLKFDPALGIQAPGTTEIRDAVATDWVQAFTENNAPLLNTEPTTPAGQLIDSEVAEIEAKNAAVMFLSNMFNPRVSEGRWQDALGYIYFLRRKIAEPTIVSCELTGLNGTVIPYGAVVKATTGETLICNTSVTIGETGQAETTFRLSETGPIEIAPHTVNQIITTVPGWDTVDNAAAGVAGRDLETRSDFEVRRAQSVAKNAHGSTGALYGEIANIPGVLDVQVLENIGPFPVVKYGVTVPGHGVTICVFGGEDLDIARAIYQKKDNGADTGGNTEITYTAADYGNAVYTYMILRPEPINFWFRVVLSPDSILTDETTAAIKQALFNDFYGTGPDPTHGRVGLASTVYASRFVNTILQIDGVKGVMRLGIALSETTPADDAYAEVLTIRGDQEPATVTDNMFITKSA